MSVASSPTVGGTRLGRLARWCYHRRRLVLGLWIVGFIGITAVSVAVPGKFQDKFSGGKSQSQLAQNLLTQRFPARAGDTADVVYRTTDPVTSSANRAAIDELDQRLAHMPDVVSVRGPFDRGGQSQLSPNGHIAYSEIQFDKTAQDLSKPAVVAVVNTAQQAAHPGFQIALGGSPIYKAETFSFGVSEIVGIWAAIFILLIAFGSLIAMGLPIMTALFGLGVGVAIIDLVSHLLTIPTFATQLAAMIGIGVGIDYALFIVTRYRQGLHDGHDPEESLVISLATAGRAVMFAGTTVVISLLGMMLMGLSFVYGLAVAAIAAVVLVMLAAITLLPAVLGFTGRAIDRLHLPHLLHKGGDRKTVAYRWSRVVQRRPWVTGGAALLVLLVLAIPLFSMRLAFSDSGNDPPSFTTRTAYDLLAQGFGPGVNGPLLIALQLPHGAADQPALLNLQHALQRDADVAFAAPPSLNPARDTAVMVVIPKTSPQDAQTQQLVHRLRNSVVPPVLAGTGVQAYIGGLTGGSVDASTQLSHRLFIVIGGVVILSFLLLMAVFRSVAVPVKAAVMNLLSIGAAYGVIVAVFQWGWAASFFGVSKTGPIDPWVPLMLFTILFGLSMDYEVFLLSRIREEWLRTGDNATSVADGLAVTARVITAAAAIMVCVFGSFVLGEFRTLKLFGLGLATAVLVDASLVRMVLVPATMELLGKANWWFPAWLDRAVPNISMEVMPDEEPVLVGASR